ncbi:MAG: glutamine--tRNA ligase/YqeY domain fusion protein [Chitinispirillaceae bacterium]|nr:glutamine--tRNA ligase/YqeY domain fusion protein [Chitinispirillaceae bacterium]
MDNGKQSDNTIDIPSNFIRDAIVQDLKSGRFQKVVTRFPPEPNGHLHIGHAKALHIDYGMAVEFNGEFHLRFDDTNPSREEEEYVQAIIDDVKWLGCDFGKHLCFASDYFEQMYEWAVLLIKAGKAFVCELNADEVRELRGTLTEPGKNSPNRDRSVEENLDLFERMRKGEFPEGSRTLRAKIDMASPNINLRDPVMYRIINAPHHRQGNKWCIYPMYDWAHGLEDSIEGITHSLCSLEYEDHRPLYDWFLDQLPVHHPRQIEFARLNLTYTVMSKRKLLRLVNEKKVSGWDDPRMPTLSGLRRRGCTPEAIRMFSERIGVAKRDSMVDVALLEYCVREDLNRRAPRFMAALRPLRVIIDNYPEGSVEELDAINNPEDPSAGSRKVPFSRELFIERDDFMEEPPKKFFRLAPGREVRLRYAYFITCTGVEKDSATGEITALRCTYDPATTGGNAPDGRSPKATIHWVSTRHAIDAEVRLYDRLFNRENPDSAPEGDFISSLNPSSLTTLYPCKIEPNLAKAMQGFGCQFERLGYFCVDPDSKPDRLIFNRTVTLKDEWARIQKRERGKP